MYIKWPANNHMIGKYESHKYQIKNRDKWSLDSHTNYCRYLMRILKQQHKTALTNCFIEQTYTSVRIEKQLKVRILEICQSGRESIWSKVTNQAKMYAKIILRQYHTKLSASEQTRNCSYIVNGPATMHTLVPHQSQKRASDELTRPHLVHVNIRSSFLPPEGTGPS